MSERALRVAEFARAGSDASLDERGDRSGIRCVREAVEAAGREVQVPGVPRRSSD